MNISLIPGYATREATDTYTKTFGKECAAGHYSDFLNIHLQLSSIGIGTFPGPASDEVDENYAEIISRALQNGINVIDTGAHYRYGRSMQAAGEGVRRALQAGVARDQLFLISKGGFLSFKDGPPQDFDAWFEQQHVLDTSITQGPKLFAYVQPTFPSTTTASGAAVFVVYYNTTSIGDEKDSSGSAQIIYWDYSFSNRLIF